MDPQDAMVPIGGDQRVNKPHVSASVRQAIVDLPDDILDAQDACMELGWGDGLPIIPPTPERVAWMLSGTARDPAEVVGVLPPRKGLATVECIAANGVMAGAKPEYLPVILAAIEAVLDPEFNVQGVNATGHNCTPLVVVSGPIVPRLDINAGMGLFGPGWRANATIGRAVRLCMLNIAGATPGESDRSVHGHPGKYTYCIGEDPGYGPWAKLNQDAGFGAETSTVTVMAAEAPHSVATFVDMDCHDILTNVADTCSTLGSNKMLTPKGSILIVLGPYNSERLFGEGWTKRDVQMFLFEHVRRRAGDLRRTAIGRHYLNRAGTMLRWLVASDDDARVPLVEDPSRFVIMATPGDNAVSSVVPNWSLSSVPITRAIES
jgi:hypothetical protein